MFFSRAATSWTPVKLRLDVRHRTTYVRDELVDGQARGVDPAASLLATALLGGALGALIGSLAGLPTPAPRA
ncbi:MAG: hypothetical protein HY332_24520 [Chloroflexi bacterium]|nr:hypothetical protein [Chloroflexota bacterium]